MFTALNIAKKVIQRKDVRFLGLLLDERTTQKNHIYLVQNKPPKYRLTIPSKKIFSMDDLLKLFFFRYLQIPHPFENRGFKRSFVCNTNSETLFHKKPRILFQVLMMLLKYCHKIKGYTRATFALFKYHASNSYFLEHFQGLIIIHK